MSTQKYDDQLQVQLAIVRPLISAEQKAQLELITNKLDPKNVDYFDNAAQIIGLVREWLDSK